MLHAYVQRLVLGCNFCLFKHSLYCCHELPLSATAESYHSRDLGHSGDLQETARQRRRLITCLPAARLTRTFVSFILLLRLRNHHASPHFQNGQRSSFKAKTSGPLRKCTFPSIQTRRALVGRWKHCSHSAEHCFSCP